MTDDTFVTGEKIELRERCEIAIDQAGHAQSDIVTVDVSGCSTKINGGIRGDLQSTDDEGFRYCYYIRTEAKDAIPKWIANIARVAHEVPDAKVYVVVETYGAMFEKSCRAAGAGLVQLTPENEFRRILNFDVTLPQDIAADFEARVGAARRLLEHRVRLGSEPLQDRLTRIVELTRDMDGEVAEKYADDVERQLRTWQEWSYSTSTKLDATFAARDLDELSQVEVTITTGPTLGVEVGDDA